jgi:hypothetical protein
VLCVLFLFVGVRVACHFSFLCCVFCFCLWEVTVDYHFSFIRKLKWQATQTPNKQKQNTQHRKLKWQATQTPTNKNKTHSTENLNDKQVCFVFVCGRSLLIIILVLCLVCFVFVCGGSVLLIIFVFCLVWVFYCGGSVLLIILVFCVVCQKTKMTSNTDPQQTKTKHTTQKTKMISNTDPPQTNKKRTTLWSREGGCPCFLSF